MTTDAATIETRSAEPATAGAAQSRVAAVWSAADRFLSHAGDWLNPILVKETRQALKSSQFTITFVLVLAACWIVTIGVVAYIGPRIFYSAEGGTLLAWYYAVLALPLLVVVPLSAFRSLTAEREDNTYDLLSITTLRPRQIISGKLGSAIAQMAVYFSVITPCLAFTYLLRGVDLPTIATLLLFTFFWSLGLSMVGILLATLTTQRFVQVFVLVGFVGGLLFMFYCGLWLGYYAGYYGRSTLWGVGNEFWIFLGVVATLYGTFFALAYFAAAGMITFTSENRSTPLRACMAVQQAAFVGWMAAAWISDNFGLEVVLVMAIISGIYWYAMGTMLTAERPTMSQRVRRRLPQSFFGRMFLSWFNPGPASGYMFVIANITAVAVLCLLAIAFGEFIASRSGGGRPTVVEVLDAMFIGWGYVVAYLGVGVLAISALRRIATVTMLASVLIHLLLLLAGFGIPYAVKSMSLELREADYSFLQVTDPVFSIWHVLDGGTTSDASVLLLLIPGVAICVLLLNVPRIIRELRVVREAAPARVLQDEAELHPTPASLPQNPWDEPV
ncbi:MAG: hypothetical protein IT427_09985 [Pirellulales bacterium]|jgi:hypothetical protein|nr:hypothetical protein [Pirellulales bacterium]